MLGVTPKRDKRAFCFGESKSFSNESSDEERASSTVFHSRRQEERSLSYSYDRSIVFHSRRQEERNLSPSEDRSIVFHSRRQEERHRTYSDNEPSIRNTPSRTRRGSIPSRYTPSPRGYTVDSDSFASSPNSYGHEPRKSPNSCGKIRRFCFRTQRRPASPHSYNYDSPRIEDESLIVDNGRHISVWQGDWDSDRGNSEAPNASKGRGPGRYWQDDDPRAPRERKDPLRDREVKTRTCSDDEVSESERETPRAQESLYNILLSPRMKDPRVPLGRMTGFDTMCQFEELKDEVATLHRADVNRAEEIAKQIADQGCRKALFERKYEDVEPFVSFIVYNTPKEAKDKFMAALAAQPENVRRRWLNLIPIQFLSYGPWHDEGMCVLARRLDRYNLNRAILGDDYDRVVRLAAPRLLSRLSEFDKSQRIDILALSCGMRDRLGIESDESSSEEAKSCFSRRRKRKRR